MRRIRLGVLLLLLTVSSADANPPCDRNPTCADRAPIAAGPYDNDGGLHKAWYEGRFWGGTCPPVLDGENCLRPDSLLARLVGADMASWYELMRAVLDANPAPARPALCARMHKLGRTMGLEWARLNHIRRICTDDLVPLFRALETAEQPETVITRMETVTRERLATDTPCDPA